MANDDPLWIGAGRDGGSIVTPGNQCPPRSAARSTNWQLFDRALTDAEIEAIRTSTPPVVTASAFSIDENSANNTVVGTVVANDQDIGDVLSYAISAGNTDGAFSIDANGQIKVANSTALDFETNPTFNLTIEATDDGSPSLSDTTTVIITLNNVNDAPVDLQATATTDGGISLNADGGNDVYFVADDGAGLLGGLNTVTIEASFSITTPGADLSPLLSYADGTNDEELALFLKSDGRIWFGASSNGSPLASTTGFYTQLFDGENHQVSVSWDASNGAVDFYIDGQLKESITGYQTGATITGTGELVFGQDQDSVLGGFKTIDVFSGELYDVRIFNDVRTAGEIAGSYDLTLPNTEPGMIANWTFNDLSTGGVITDSVTGNNLTEQHVVGAGFSSSIPSLSFSIPENSTNGTTIGSVVAIDPDTGDSFAYTLVDDAGGRFAINSATGQITLADTSLVDYETATSHNVTIRVTDAGGLTYDEVFTISVLNVNDSPAITSDGGGATANVNVAENTSSVTTVTATDADLDTLTYSLDPASDDDGFFTIDPNSGVLTFTSTPDYETPADLNGDNVYEVTVLVSDGGGGVNSQAISVTVTDANDQLSATNTSQTKSYTEDDPSVALDDIMVTDVDTAEIITATLTLADIGAGSLTTSGTASYNAGTGVWTITDTVANVNAALVLASFTPATNYDQNTTIAVNIADGGENSTTSVTGTINLNVTPVNDAPSVNTTGTQLAYAEDDGPVSVDAGITLSDIDSTDLTGATVRIASGFASTEDSLAFVDQSGITGSYDAGTGILTLSGTASVADYQAALRSVTYENTSEIPNTTNRTISFQVSDGASSTGSTRTVTVASINDDPINSGSLPTDVTVTEDALGYVDLSTVNLSDVDASNGLVTVTLKTSTGGKLWASSDFDVTVLGSGSSIMTLTGGVSDLNNFFSSAFRFSYRHDTPHIAGDNADTIQLEINDNGNTGTGGSGTIVLGTVNVDITPVNDAPVRTAGTVSNLTVLEDSGFTSLGLAGVTYGSGGGSDESSQTLTYEVTTIPDSNYFGKIYLADGTTQVSTGFYTLTQIQGMQFQTVSDENGGPSFFSYRVQDSGGTASGGTDSFTETIQITITPQNDAPSMIMAGDSLSYTENDGPVVVDAALAVSDVDSANLTGATVSIVGGFVSAEDTLAFVDQLGITGSYDAGTGVLTLSGTASVADYQAALRSITYENTSGAPNTANRVISFQVSDGTASGGNSRTVTVTPVNDAPVLNVAGTSALTQINEGDINNPGDSVAGIIASAGGSPITDVDASAVEGIAMTWADSSNGTWQYSTDAGSVWNNIGAVSDTSAFLLTDATSNRIRFVPDENFNGTAQFSYRAWDRTDGNVNATAGVDVSINDGATAYSAATEMANLTIQPVEVVLYLSTSNDVSISGTPGLDSWAAGELLAMGDPNVDLEPGTTNGTFYSFLDLRDFDTGAVPPKVDGVHQVSKNVTIGGNGGPSMDLFLGDILFSINTNSTQLTGSDAVEITTNKKSLYLFRPDTPGDYSAGTFSVVLDNFSTNEVEGISLVEADTLVGDTLLQAGSFIYNPGNSTDIWLYTVDGAGEGTTSGNAEILITGDHINMNNASAKISGLDLIEATIDIGDTRLTAGNILVTLDGNDSGIGSNNLTVTSNDVFYLDVTTTTLGVTNTSVANAYLLIEGADLNLDTADEEITALSLELKFGSGGNEDPDISFPGGSISYTENDPAVLIDAGATVNDPDSLDFSTGILRVDFSAGGTADDRLTIRNEGSGAGQIGVAGSDVTYGGVTIGTFTGGIGTSPLVINFNSNATSAVVQATLRNITYENVSDDPATTPRNVRVVLTDGDDGTSNVEHKTINVTASQ